MKTLVSIIIVHYKVKKELYACLDSIKTAHLFRQCEVIVIDNDDDKKTLTDIKKKYPWVLYMRMEQNLGYGAANNLGAAKAKGEYVFFLNPDTTIDKNTIKSLLAFSKNTTNVGCVAPLLTDKQGTVYPFQGNNILTPLNAFIILTGINRYFPNNSISKIFFHTSWKRKNPEVFPIVPGTAFMIKKKLFEKVGQFDTKFFLFFEEYDLGLRLKKLGKKSYIIPTTKVMHIWEASTKKRTDIENIFLISRFYYFKKHFGFLSASVVAVITSVNKWNVFIFLLLLFCLFLATYRIHDLMVFIGDQGWFYLSARDSILDKTIPLVGIPSSRVWLHQGPYWTYILAFFLLLFQFDPVSGVYPSIAFYLATVVALYIIGKSMFSARVGAIASLLYATSPLTVTLGRLPYHTSPMPFFTLLFMYALYKIKDTSYAVPLSIALLSILYNFELATIILAINFFFVLFLHRKKLHTLRKKNIFVLSLLAFVFPMTPILLWDITHGFPQTVKFLAWILYKIISFLNIGKHTQESSLASIPTFIGIFLQKLFFIENWYIGVSMFLVSFGYILYKFYKNKYSLPLPLAIVVSMVVSPLIGITISSITSEAYLPLLYPSLLLLYAYIFHNLATNKGKVLAVALLLFLVVASNITFLFRYNFSLFPMQREITLRDRVDSAERIISLANNKPYKIVGLGEASRFRSFTMNYEYLTWWLGHPMSSKADTLHITVQESEAGVTVNVKDISNKSN